MPIRQTSITSFQQLLEDGILGERQTQVLTAIQENPGCTDRALTYLCQLPINVITARRHELEDLNLIRSNGIIRDLITKRNVHSWIFDASGLNTIRQRKAAIGTKVRCPCCQGHGWIINGQMQLKWGLDA